MIPDIDLRTIPDDGSRRAIQALLQLVETLSAENRTLREEVQRLRDETSRLKGEQGKPTIRPQPRTDPPPAPTDHSSEAERRTPTPRQKGRKVATITVDRTEPCVVDPALLPPDAERKGSETVIVQDLLLCTDNVAFEKEIWYAPSTGKTYRASLPAGYDGAFGPNIKALALALHYASNVSQPLLLAFFVQAGIQLSAGTLAGWLIHDQDAFHAEKDAIVDAGLASSPWQQIDDTATRVNGRNQVCQVLGNPLYTAYRTAPSKTRLAVLDALRNGRPRTFRLNDDALAYLDVLHLPQRTREQLLLALPWNQDLDDMTLTTLLATHLPTLTDGVRKHIQDALAVASYHAQVDFPVIRLLLCDDAPQFHLLVDDLALCWVHEGRHYKKLTPVLAVHQRALARFQTRFWAFYRGLLRYRDHPDPAARRRLIRGFGRLFATVTGYDALDERIVNTRSKHGCLLLVLDHPEIPLHNNAMELGARRRVRKRDVSFGPRTDAGARAWDTFQTIIATAQKLGVNAYHYLRDRLSGAPQLPALADLITERAATLPFGASWVPA